MKKIVLIILALALILSLFACGKKPVSDNTTSEEITTVNEETTAADAESGLETSEIDTSGGYGIDVEEVTLDEVPVVEE